MTEINNVEQNSRIFKLNGKTLKLNRIDDNKLELQKLISSEEKGNDVFVKVATKSYNHNNGVITRKQFDETTGKLIGKSKVETSTKFRSGAIYIKDHSTIMDSPYHFFKGKISKFDKLQRKGLVFDLAQGLTPIAKRFVKLLRNS